MLTRSAKSVRSIRSLSTAEDDWTTTTSREGEIITVVFEELLPCVCKKFGCDFELYIKKELHRDGVDQHKKLDAAVKHKHITLLSPKLDVDDDCNVIKLTSVYDNDSLVEIFLINQKRIPRLLMQAINEISPLYEDLNKITIRNCKIDDASIIYELNKLLSMTFITDVCLDDSFVKEGNYYILLDKGITLKQLSLCRCFITDVVCEKIVSKLHFPSPAEKNMLILNLSGNCITDEGAKSIGIMLRSNRNLRYLNLAGNRIEDEGAYNIFDALKEFPLTYDEMDEKRRRLFAYLKRKNTLTNKFMSECQMQLVSSSFGISSDSVGTSEPKELDLGDDQAQSRAKMLAEHLIGRLEGPYYSHHIRIKDGWSYCVGNFTLSYLNLSYNNLTYLSVKKILVVLRYQSFSKTGLLKIILEGNPMPIICSEYSEISALINKKLTKHIVKGSFHKKQRVSRISGISKK